MWKRLRNWWDWRVYWFAWASMRRIATRDPGMVLMFKLYLDEWLSKHPPSEAVEDAAHELHRAMRDYQPVTSAGETEKE